MIPEPIQTETTSVESSSNDKISKVESTAPKPALTYNEIQEQLGLTPTTIVLAKVKGYRPWPAMVLEEDILPENIKKIKPKTVRLEKKSTKPVINVPVRFFSDDTYIWIKSCDLKILGEQTINEFLAKRASQKKHDLLIDAYKLAQDPPDMREFNMWGSAGEPDPNAQEPATKKLKLSIKLKSTPKKATKKSTASTKSTKPEQKKEPKKPRYVFDEYDDLEEDDDSEPSLSPAGMLHQEGYDSDWGLDEPSYDFKSGDFIFEKKEDQEKFATEFPRGAELAAELEEYQEEVSKIHSKIAKSLVDGKESDERIILSQLRNLEKLLTGSKMPLVAFVKSPLYRVLLLIMHRPKEQKLPETVRKAIKNIMLIISLEPCEISTEDLEPETKAESENKELATVKEESSNNNESSDETTEKNSEKIEVNEVVETLDGGKDDSNGTRQPSEAPVTEATT